MRHLQTLFGSIESVQCRTHDGKFAPVQHDPQKEVQRHLESGLSITVSQCYKLYHTHDLRKIISRLRLDKGMNIDGVMYRDKYSNYKIYSLAKEKK